MPRVPPGRTTEPWPQLFPLPRTAIRPLQVPTRRELFALAAVLAATVLTAGAAVSGLRRTPAPVQQSPPVVDQIIRQAPAPAPPRRVEPGD